MRGLITNFFRILSAVAIFSLLLVRPACADYVGELETTKFFDQATIDLITTRLTQGTGLLAGDTVTYFIQFTPTDNGGSIGGGGFVTDYIPAGTQVIDAQFVRMNSDGTYTQIAPPTPAAMYPAYVPMYSDTGIFYSTDPRTAVYPGGGVITQSNGYASVGPGCNNNYSAQSLPSTAHNAWDQSMENAFGGQNTITQSGTCDAPPALTYTNVGLSPVAGPDTYLTQDVATTSTTKTASVTITTGRSTTVNWTGHGLAVNQPITFTGTLPTGMTAGTTYYVSSVTNANSFQITATLGGGRLRTSGSSSGVTATAVITTTGFGTGPWQRISYPGSMKGTATGTPVAGMDSGTAVTGCVGGTPTSAGWNLSAANPLPINTNAVRFAAGKVTVGELFTARISLKLTADLPAGGGIVNNTEVFGGDIGLDIGNGGGFPSYWNQWRYFCPAVAVSNSKLLVVKKLVGMCIGTGCTPTPIIAGVVPNAANLKLRYTVLFVNLSGATQTNVQLTDVLASGAVYVANSYTSLNGTNPGAPSGTTTLTFPTVNLGPGGGGTVQYDVNIAAAQPDGTALINTATLVSTEVPGGVTSKAIATVSSQANLWIQKTTSTSSVASGGTATYTITIPNNGGSAVIASATTPITVNDFLPTDGLTTAVTDRFTYAGAVTAQTWTAAGVATNVTPAVTTTAPGTAAASEQVQFNFTSTSATIPIGGKMTITFNATVGSNVPSSATPYLNSANVYYAGGPGGTAAASSMSETIGVAPVTVTAPMSLAAKVDCVYAGAICVAYTTGTIAPGSKVRYRLSYKDISAASMLGVVLTDTLPANTSFVTGSAIRDGSAVTPAVAGQVLTFPTIAALAAGASGYVTFDVQLGAAVTSGTDITNTAKLTATSFPAGVTASVTTSVRDQANLQITKTVSPSVIQAGGTVTYTITVTNTGNAVASGIVLYDELPFTGSVVDATARFNYTAAGSYALTNTSGTSTLAYVTPTVSVPPTFTGYTVNTNRQEVMWAFAAAQQLGVGDSFTLTYTVAAGANVPASATAYTSDVQAQYISATNTMYASTTNTAAVTIGGLDHILITHDGSGLTCAPSTVTITACANTSCTAPYYSGGASVTLTPGGQTFIIDATGVNTAATVTQTTAGTVTLATSSVTPTPNYSATCWNTVTSSASCSMTFADAGLIFWDAAAAGGTGAEMSLPTQIAGVTFAQSAGTPTSYVLRAVKADKVTKACVSAFNSPNPPTQTIGFGYECNDPATCASGNLLSVNGTAVQSNGNGGNIFGNYSYTGISINFDTNGYSTTPIYFSYEDVGRITLRVYDKINGKDVFGNSNSFIVKPHHFAVDVCDAGTVGDCPAGTVAATSASAVLAKAGTNSATQTGTGFKASVRPMSANNNVTPSFSTAVGGNDALGNPLNTVESVTLAGACTAPFIGAATSCPGAGVLHGTGTTTGTGTISSLTTPDGPVANIYRSDFGSSNVATVSDLSWSEVGLIKLTANNASFMNAGSASGTSLDAGRFIPDHFETTVAGQMSCDSKAGCAAPVTSMAYSGQGFQVQVRAANANCTATTPPVCGQTANYQAAFAKGANLSAVASAGGAAVAASDGAMTTTTNLAATDFIGGSAQPAANNAQVFTFAASTPPHTPFDVYIRADEPTGGDSVSSLRSANSVEGGVRVVSGRIKITNAYGTELLPLSLTAMAQYYTANSWVLSSTDTITKLILAATYGVGSGTTAVTLVPSNGGLVSGGKLTINLSKPSNGAGVATIVPGQPAYLTQGTGTATFGVYNANSSYIYRRENY